MVPGHFAAHQFTETLLCTLRESVPGDWSIVISYKPYGHLNLYQIIAFDFNTIRFLENQMMEWMGADLTLIVLTEALTFCSNIFL